MFEHIGFVGLTYKLFVLSLHNDCHVWTPITIAITIASVLLEEIPHENLYIDAHLSDGDLLHLPIKSPQTEIRYGIGDDKGKGTRESWRCQTFRDLGRV